MSADRWWPCPVCGGELVDRWVQSDSLVAVLECVSDTSHDIEPTIASIWAGHEAFEEAWR